MVAEGAFVATACAGLRHNERDVWSTGLARRDVWSDVGGLRGCA